jgi:hypothetical protein
LKLPLIGQFFVLSQTTNRKELQMEYRAVQNRCAVHLPSLKLPVTDVEALTILENNGFKVLEVDLIALARQCIKASTYHRGAKPSEAPAVVDCSSFIKWLYGQHGIWLPPTRK